MADLFGCVSRDERQAQCLDNWIKAKGHATVVAATGFGKSRVGTNLIGRFLAKHPEFQIIVVVPTTTLKEQWENILDNLGYGLNCKVYVINSIALKEVKYECNLLILDEIHRFVSSTFQRIFDLISYRFILGLTATIERLDGKEILLKKYCPVCDTVSLQDCLSNGWISPYKEYEVLIEVDNIAEYKQYNKEFTEHFGFFNFDFSVAMSMTDYRNRLAYRDKLCPRGSAEEKSATLKSILYHYTSFMRAMQARKAFINNHPKKVEIAKKIIEARPDAKIITFSNNVAMAESIGYGKVYTGKDSKKKGRATLEELQKGDIRVINSCSKANEGLDVPDLSIAIMLGIDSSTIKAQQRVGRVARKFGDKNAEVFNIIIDNSAETEWFRKSHTKSNYTVIDEEGLNQVLNHEEITPYKKKIPKLTFRF